MELPRRLGNYIIEEWLHGGEADVYRARDVATGRMALVEILSETACADEEARQRFLQEAAACEHGEDENGQPFLVRTWAPAAMPGPTIVARKPSPARGSRGWAGWIAVAVGLAALGAGAAHYWPKPKPKPQTEAPAATVTPSGQMLLVPAGAFLFGESKQSAWLPAFYIDKTEVTNAAYAVFCKASNHPLPPDFRADQPDYPVVNVSMEDAKAFAAWAGKRIPTGREWEKAARGEHGQAFPWGDQADRSRANVGLALLLPASAFPKGASPYGALQMIGNAWEWVSDLRSPTDEETESFTHRMHPPLASDELWFAVRGGGYDYPQLTPMLMWDTRSAPGRWQSSDIGFRCVKDVP